MKRLIIAALAVVVSMASAGISFAATNSCNGVATWALADVACEIGATAKMEIKGSKNVKMAYSGNAGLTYSLGAFHTQGNKQFATSSGDQKIFWIDMQDPTTPADLVAAPETTTAGSSWTAGWSAL